MEKTNLPIRKPHRVKVRAVVGPALVDILDDVAKVFEVESAAIVRKGRKGITPIARMIYGYVSCKITNATLTEIGAVVAKDHTLPIYYRDQCKDRIAIQDPTFLLDWMRYTSESKIWAKYGN